MIFCTQCGHKNVDDALFCEECGHGLKLVSPAPAVLPVASVATRKPLNKKLLKSIAAGTVALIAVVAGLSIFLAPPSASNASFATAIDKFLMAKPLILKDRYCLDNFPYGQPVVNINPNDNNTRVLLEVLSKAGIYGEPVEEMNNQGLFLARSLKYSKTDAGNKATQGAKLCVADGVSVARVESFTPPEKSGELQFSRATVQLKLNNPLPFVSGGELASVLPNLKPEFAQDMVLYIKDGTWQVADEQTIRQLSQTQLKKSDESGSVSASAGSSGGFMGKLLNMFSFGGNPVLGKWRSSWFGAPTVFEFQSDSMVSPLGRMPVRYEVNGSEVTIYSKNSSIGDIISVTDSDHLVLHTGGLNLQLVRVK